MAGYLGAIPVPQATQHRESFTATSGQTTFNTAGYTVGFLDVYLNGSHLSPADFTATNGSDVVLASGASTGDVCDIISYTAFEVNAQTFTGTTTLTGNLLLGDNDKAIFGAGSDLQIYHDGSDSIIADVGTGHLRLLAEDFRLQDASASETYITAAKDGAVTLRFNDSTKLATTNTGIDVTGAVTADKLNVTHTGGSDFVGVFQNTTSATPYGVHIKDAASGANGYPLLQVTNSAGSSPYFLVHSGTGNVGIGTASPDGRLDVTGSGNTEIYINTGNNSGDNSRIFFGDTADIDVGWLNYDHGTNSMSFGVNATERMRIDTSGNLLVGKTSSNTGSLGAEFRSDGLGVFGRSADYPLILNRTTSDGGIALFRKDGSTVGSIGTVSGYIYLANNDGDGMALQNNSFRPATSAGANQDNIIDLGLAAARFDDIYATNGTIQTSDRNEKQDIAALTSAEMLVAKRISALFKTFRWKDSVAEKGNNARTHTGIIAQDVQAAFTAESLDAGDYSLFISTTWWEHDVDVPAVEAADAVDAVYREVTDSDGMVTNELVTPAKEAVEAVDAYTRTDTYDTEDEAPAGATSKTRMGIRYPELLSFVAAYNEQRFAAIETRLTALEGE